MHYLISHVHKFSLPNLICGVDRSFVMKNLHHT